MIIAEISKYGNNATLDTVEEIPFTINELDQVLGKWISGRKIKLDQYSEVFSSSSMDEIISFDSKTQAFDKVIEKMRGDYFYLISDVPIESTPISTYTVKTKLKNMGKGESNFRMEEE